MNAGLILRVPSRRDAQNERNGADLRSSVAAALRAALAPSQQHQLRRGRDAQNERDRAGSSDSVAAATLSQLRRSSAACTMSGRRGIGQPLDYHLAAPRIICHCDTQTVFFQNINIKKEY